MNEQQLRVVCLCAGWCGVCRDYRVVFDDASAAFGAHAVFSWIDIEDDAALVDDVDVENFPTILILSSDRPLFFGPITPHPGTLARLVQGAVAGDLRALAVESALEAFAQRLGGAD